MRHVATLIFLIVNIAVFGLLSQLKSPAGWLLYVPLTLMLASVTILVHETGHALAARAYGRRIERFVAIPFEIGFRPFRIRLADPNAAGGDLGGFVNYSLEWPETRREHALIAFAGPAANFLLALVAALLAVWVVASAAPELRPIAIAPASYDGPAPSGMLPSTAEMNRIFAESAAAEARQHLAKAVATIANALAALSAGTGLANLIPFRGSDGDSIVGALFRGRFRA